MDAAVRGEGGADLVMRVEDDDVGCAEDVLEGTGSVLMKLMTRQIGGSMVRETFTQGCAVVVRIPKAPVRKG